MAFALGGFATFATGAALAAGDRRRQLHYYISGDAQATIAASDYFVPVAGQIGVGDIIFVVGGGATETLSSYVVQTCTATGVTVTKAA